MIPLWSIPMAIATGSSLIVKPSERDPGAVAIIAELCERAGLPKGVLSILHGSVDAVNFICDEPLIKAITFVGGNAAGKHIFDRGGANGKRVRTSAFVVERARVSCGATELGRGTMTDAPSEANLGAKNHCMIMPEYVPNIATL